MLVGFVVGEDIDAYNIMKVLGIFFIRPIIGFVLHTCR